MAGYSFGYSVGVAWLMTDSALWRHLSNILLAKSSVGHVWRHYSAGVIFHYSADEMMWHQ